MDRSAWLRLSGLVLLAACLTAIVAWRSIEASQLHGRLSVPPLYDDVSYFFSAVRWTNAASDRSMFASLWDLLRQHAPFSTLVAIIGFALFPGSYIGPYLVHAVAVFAFLFGIIWLLRGRPVLEIAACLLAVPCVPVVWHTVTEARPDLPSGLAIGLAAGAIVHRGVLARRARSLAMLGVACALAASIKPTSFPAALVLLGSAFAIRLFVDCIEAGGLRSSNRSAWNALLWFVLPLIATTAALIGPALVETVAYILDVFVGQRDLWTTGESFWAGLLRFSIGGEGQFGLHYWFAIGLASMLLRLVLAAIDGRAALLDAAVLLAAALVAYAIPSLRRSRPTISARCSMASSSSRWSSTAAPASNSWKLSSPASGSETISAAICSLRVGCLRSHLSSSCSSGTSSSVRSARRRRCAHSSRRASASRPNGSGLSCAM
jgi:hypothetical protein